LKQAAALCSAHLSASAHMPWMTKENVGSSAKGVGHSIPSGNDKWISGVWLNPYSVVHRSAKPLFAAEIFFRRLHGHMSQ
jgi:hypothetical protein